MASKMSCSVIANNRIVSLDQLTAKQQSRFSDNVHDIVLLLTEISCSYHPEFDQKLIVSFKKDKIDYTLLICCCPHFHSLVKFLSRPSPIKLNFIYRRRSNIIPLN